jgi:hypothetical protein
MEARVLHGGENLVDKMSDLKKLAKATKAELEVKQCAPHIRMLRRVCFCAPCLCWR